MSKKRITLELDTQIIKKLESRAKKNHFSLREQIYDILRRSAISSGKKAVAVGKTEDRLVSIFSRKGRKK